MTKKKTAAESPAVKQLVQSAAADPARFDALDRHFRERYAAWWSAVVGLVEQIQSQARAIESAAGDQADDPIRRVVDLNALSDVRVDCEALSCELHKAAPKPAPGLLPDPLS